MIKGEKKNRNGDRMRREDRTPRKRKLGNYLFVTDGTKTEVNYLSSLIRSLGFEPYQAKIIKDRTQKLIPSCKKAIQDSPKYYSSWIILDRDQVVDFDDLIERGEREGLNVCWSNPCIETWFSAYFGKILTSTDSVNCCLRFSELYKRKTRTKYRKNDERVFTLLEKYGSRDTALERSRMRHGEHIKNGYTKPSEMVPDTVMFELIDEIG